MSEGITNLTQNERAARIDERRKRISAQIDALNQTKGDDIVDDSANQQQISVTDRVVSEQLNMLRKEQIQYSSHVESLKQRADAEAGTINSNDQLSREKRKIVIQQEKEKAAMEESAFQMKWTALLQKQPEEIAAGIIELRKLMIDTLKSKDEVIDSFENYLGQVDDDFLRLTNEQTAEIDEIIKYSKESIKKLQQQCQSAVDECEKTFDAQRQQFITEHEGEVENLLTDVGKIEENKKQERIQIAKKYFDDVSLQILTDYNEYTNQKRRLEAEGAALRSQLEEMRAVYHLNADKLEYNYKLLASRDIECQNLIVQQKSKQQKLARQLNATIARHEQTDAKLRKENLELSVQYRRLANSYCDLQRNFKVFERADTQKFRQLWAFHEQQITTLLKELLLSEQVINESIICSQPKKEVDEDTQLDMIRQMLKRLQASAKVIDDVYVASLDQQQQEMDITKSINAVEACQAGKDMAEQLLTSLCKMVNFLASDELLKTSDPDAEIDDMARIRALQASLGIKNPSELDLLFHHITKDQKCQELVPRDKIIEQLIKFAEDLTTKRGENNSKNQSSSESQKQKTGIWSQKQVAQFWKEIAQIVSPEKSTAWKMLENSLKTYQSVLMARVDLVERNDDLAGQNEELRSLLQQYVEGEKRGLDSMGGQEIPANQGQGMQQYQPNGFQQM